MMNEQPGSTQEQHTFQEQAANTMPPLRFGNYDLIRRIDIGGMGEVYLARQRNAFGREVAIKIMRSDLVHDAVARKRFLREAEVTAHLLHEHILPLIEFSDEDGRLFLVTPYIKGGTLAERIDLGSLSLPEVYQLFTALVQAVAYIHRRGVIHRDLKPNNILLDSEDDGEKVYVRLIDFGIASNSGEQSNTSLTQPGGTLGTAAYMAPERLDGVVSPANDIYSLGIILYEMLTGELPKKTGRVFALPPQLNALIRRCITANPEGRFASADELLQEFQQAYENMARVPPLQRDAQRPTQDEATLPPLSGKSASSAKLPVAQPRRPFDMHEVKVHRAELILSPLPEKGTNFRREDYSAPTSYVKPEDLSPVQLANEQDLPPTRNSRKRKRSLIGILTASSLAILVIIGAMGYLLWQSAITANVVVSPRVAIVSKVLLMNAQPNMHAIDPTTATLPATVLTSNKTGTLSGQTSGQSECVLGIFNCHQAVSLTDVDALAVQERPVLRSQIAQDLQQQAHNTSCTIVGQMFYTDGDVAANPPLGSASKTVAVTLTEQGSVECVKNQDVHTLTTEMFQQQVPANYTLLDALTEMGQPVVKGIDQNGVVKLAVPMAGIAQYQVSDTELADIQTHIGGMKVPVARAYIARLPGLDTTATSIHLSYGDTVPTNVGQIHVTTANPTNLPTVTLPKA